ncbi:MAG: NUDIX domain-containing protein, partial [Sphingobium sp.]
PGDADAIAAALREAEEEIALPRELVRVVGTSDPYKTFTGFDIMPVVGVIPPDLSLAPHEQEVESVFELPLDFAMHPRNRARKTMEFQGTVRPYYEINWQDYRIWGVTAAILVNLSRRLGYSADDV